MRTNVYIYTYIYIYILYVKVKVIFKSRKINYLEKYI